MQVVLACARTNKAAKALAAFDLLRVHPRIPPSAPLEPPALRALVLAVGKAAGSGSGAGAGSGGAGGGGGTAVVSAAQATALLAAMAGVATLDEGTLERGALGALDKEVSLALILTLAITPTPTPTPATATAPAPAPTPNPNPNPKQVPTCSGAHD